MEDLKRGDLVKFREATINGWWKYRHWAVYVGNGEVVHIQDTSNGHRIVRQTIEEYCEHRHRKCNPRRHVAKSASLPPEVVVQRASSCVGKEVRYHPIFNNCEHFANWCKYGKRSSQQVYIGMASGGAGIGAISGGVASIGIGLSIGLGSVAVAVTGGLAGGVIGIVGICAATWMILKLKVEDEKCKFDS